MARVVIRVVFLSALAVLPACTNEMPPPGALMAQAAYPTIGTSWVMHESDSGDRGYTAVATTYRGAPAYGIQRGNSIDILNPQTFNYMATITNGKETKTSSPDDGKFSWPLWVGKSWSVRVTTESPGGSSPPSVLLYNREVTAYEDVTVEAGTFKAFRIESLLGPGVDPGYHWTLWYAPSLAYLVKSDLSTGVGALGGAKTISIEMVTPP